jgi:hypothetical protein
MTFVGTYAVLMLNLARSLVNCERLSAYRLKWSHLFVRIRVAQLYPQAPGSLFVASCGPHYIAPAWTAYETLFLAVPLFLHMYLLLWELVYLAVT